VTNGHVLCRHSGHLTPKTKAKYATILNWSLCGDALRIRKAAANYVLLLCSNVGANIVNDGGGAKASSSSRLRIFRFLRHRNPSLLPNQLYSTLLHSSTLRYPIGRTSFPVFPVFKTWVSFPSQGKKSLS
jgi:hypothetical protein